MRTMDAAVAAAARTTRMIDEQGAASVRKGFAAAKLLRVESERAALSAEARLRASRTFQMECRRLRRRRAEAAALAAPLALPTKGFDAADLGQGRKGGGGLMHQRARASLWRRVVALFPDLPEHIRADMDRTWQRFDEVGARRLGPAWGHVVRDEMLKLKTAAEQGDKRALLCFCREQRRLVPKAEITV